LVPRKRLNKVISCSRCGKEFNPTTANQKFCSRDCGGRGHRLLKTTSRVCAYCGKTFESRSTHDLAYCSYKCQMSMHSDTEYFDGMRRTAIGFDENACWVCGKIGAKIQVHHVVGHADDMTEPLLVVLCRGCHHLVTHLGRRIFLDDPGKVADLLTLARFAKQLPDAKTVVRYEETQEANNMPDNGAQVSSPGLRRRESAQARETAGDSPSANGHKARAADAGRRPKSGTIIQLHEEVE